MEEGRMHDKGIDEAASGIEEVEILNRQIDAVAYYKQKAQENDNRFRDLCAAFAMLIVLIVLQYVLNVDGIVTFLVGTLAGAIASYFGLNAIDKGKGHTTGQGREEVSLRDRWRR
jgi:Na+/H+-translocating membrane pyrophosphatase